MNRINQHTTDQQGATVQDRAKARATALAEIRTAGFHGDGSKLLEVLAGSVDIELLTARRTFEEGREARVNGGRCGCAICVTKSPSLTLVDISRVMPIRSADPAKDPAISSPNLQEHATSDGQRIESNRGEVVAHGGDAFALADAAKQVYELTHDLEHTKESLRIEKQRRRDLVGVVKHAVATSDVTVLASYLEMLKAFDDAKAKAKDEVEVLNEQPAF